jgi:hypothetical protein
MSDIVPEYMNKINSDKKAIECGAIFSAECPTPSELLWLFKFLRFVGYSKREVQEIMEKHAQWSKYSRDVAYQQFEKIF